MDFTVETYSIVVVAAFIAQVLGGIAGYGTGLIMPLVLVPLIGPHATIPVIALSALITNPIRVLTFRSYLDKQAAVTAIYWLIMSLTQLTSIPAEYSAISKALV